MTSERRIDQSNFLVTVDDLGDILHPFFNKSIGKLVGKALLKALKVDELNKIHAEYCYLHGNAVTKALLSDSRINVTYTIHGKENLELMKEMGAFFTISNHPYGGIDGIILIDILGSVREDFKVLVNGFLNRITALKDYWIPVQPRVNRKDYVHDPTKNIFGIRRVAQQVEEGHPVGMFPAGGIPHFDPILRRPIEQPWQMNNVKIMRSAKIPVFPIMFEGNNSDRYFRFGRKHGYSSASILLPSEILNKKGRSIDVFIGEPIMSNDVAKATDLKALREMLMRRSLGLLPSYQEILDRVKYK